jgi:hypothetical protein
MRRSVVVGAVAGGVLGGTAGAVIDREKRPRGAVIGGLTGAAAGAGAGWALGVAASLPRTPGQLARRAARFGVNLAESAKPIVAWAAQNVLLDIVVPAIDSVAGSAADLLDALEAREKARRG